MRKCSYGIAMIMFATVLLVGCGKNEINVETYNLEESQPQKIQIADLGDAWDTILNNSTKAFIGGHPIDENFLSMITSVYGDDVIQEIASYANFETPEIWYQLTGKSIHVLWYEYCKSTGIQSYSLDRVYEINTDINGDVILNFSGDISFANGVATTEYMDHQINGIKDCFSADLLSEMQLADIMMVNNEFAYTTRGEALSGKAYTFRADPSRADLLKELGVDAVSLANNHVFDYGETGLIDTLDTLRTAQMPFVGAGVNIEEAKKPIYFIAGGRKIAVCSATQIERTLNYTREATGVLPGVLKCLHPEVFCSVIREAKANADYVIVIPHWGTEGNSHYGGDQTALARSFVEAGADVIIGGHTHCLQAIEYMDDVPIFYSLGNYWFSITGEMPADYHTGLAQIKLKEDGQIDAYFKPCEFSSGVTSLLNKDDKAYSDIIDSLNSLSDTAQIDKEGHITKKQ